MLSTAVVLLLCLKCVVNIHFLQAYLFNDYWEDIGTIRSFFEANLALTEQVCTNSKRMPSKLICYPRNHVNEFKQVSEDEGKQTIDPI